MFTVNTASQEDILSDKYTKKSRRRSDMLLQAPSMQQDVQPQVDPVTGIYISKY